MSNLVLVYGTLRTGMSNNRIMQQAGGKFIDSVEISGVKMYSLHGGYPGVVPSEDKNDYIFAELWKIKDITKLDALEGYSPQDLKGSLYIRQLLRIDGYPAWIYFWNRKPSGNVIHDWKEYIRIRGRGDRGF